ncbi:hypothetical protein pEaSNUABM52_00154 [Erwinia phage pEp_SNUABM_52]|nr:hypothetical protein pEaSNUABM52_00154 [Erwinia phage pEp_SNUABM_52]
MVLSESASYDDAVSKYAWLKFTGSRGKEVSQRTHKRMIREGDIFGILPLRNGSRYTLIFPDIPHIDFPLDMQTGKFLMDRSSKMRKTPEIVKNEGRVKTAGAKTLSRLINRTNFDQARFQPKKVPNESVNGINFASYQWRMVPTNDYTVKTSKGIVKFHRNDMIGVRFKRQGKGGVLVNTDGLYLLVPDDEFDKFVADTNIIPYQEWPEGSVDAEAVIAYRKSAKKNRRRSEAEEREAIRLADRARILERKQQQKEISTAQRNANAAEEAELKEMRRKIRSGEIEAPKRDVNTIYQDSPELDKRRRNSRIIEHEALEEEEDLEHDLDEDFDHDIDLDVEIDENEQRMGDIIGRSPFAGDTHNIEDTIGSLFGGDDTHDEVDPEFDLSDMDEPEDDEEETPPPSKVRSKKAKPAAVEHDAEEEEPEEEESDDEEEDTSDSDPDVDNADDEESDAESDDDSGDESLDDSEDDDAGDDSADEDSEDADASDAVDETGADEDGDSDVAAAEKEAAETAKKIAAENKSTPSQRAEEPEEGDVVKFRADVKLNRDWLIVKVSTHEKSDNIVTYTVYDITNSPDEVRQVRINRARKQNLFDYAEHVKDMAPKLFNKVYDIVEDYPVNKDPIAS